MPDAIRSASSRQAPSSTVQQRTVSGTAAISHKPPCDLHPKSVVSDKAILTGTNKVSLGANSVLHPYAKLDTSIGPVHIGQNCIISERTVVGLVETVHNSSQDAKVEIEDNVSIEIGATVQARRIGKSTMVDVNAVIGVGADIGEFCHISSGCTIDAGEHVPDFTIVYGSNQRRVDTTTKSRLDVRELKVKGQAMHTETLRKLIPSNIAKWQT